MSRPGTIVEGLGGGTLYVLLREIGPNAGCMAAPINATGGVPEVVELGPGGFKQTSQEAAMALWGKKITHLRQKHGLL